MSGSIIPSQTNTNKNNYLFALAGATSGVQTITAGSNVSVSGTSNVTINALGTVASIIAGSNVSVSGTSNVTINSVGTVASIIAGSNVSVSGTSNVTVNAIGTVAEIIAGSNISVSGTSNVTINATNFNNFVSYNVGGGYTASPFTITNLANGAFTTLTTVDHTVAYPQAGAAYQLTFSWNIRSATFASAPSGNIYAVVVNGPTVTSGSTIGQSACFVNADIPAPPTVGAIALGTCSCLIYNDNDVDVSIGFGNFSGQTITTAQIEIFSVSVTFLSGNPTVVNNF